MINKLISSIIYAKEGIIYAVKSQLNFRIELLAVLILFVTYYVLNITVFEWMIVIMSLGYMLVSELINTALEVTCDLISLKYDINIKRIKDVAAGSVLFCSFIVVAVNSIIIYNHLMK